MPSATESSSRSPAGAQLKLPALTPRRKRSSPENPLPVPETPPLPPPPDVSSLTPTKPTRRILSPEDHQVFLSSPTDQLILSFVFSLSEACADTKRSSITSTLEDQPQIVRGIKSILASVSGLVDENPAEDQGASRFGNPAFRSFVDSLAAHSSDYHKVLQLPSEEWTQELSPYFESSFGSRSRIDYGSGHELNFLTWLLCLNRLSVLPPSTFAAVALSVFPQYIALLRKIQSTYYLEPAGSHGVWGLDDYHFLPFLFGASQLLHHPYIRPKAIHNDIVLEEEGDEFLYLDMVRWTVATKTVKGLKWTQPMLDDISGAKDWVKIEQGMRRMFVKEVLGKLPIMQHFLFGSLVPADPRMSHDSNGTEAADGQSHTHKGHLHEENSWGDCCGIKIPSTVAASEEAKKHGGGGGLRRVPFD